MLDQETLKKLGWSDDLIQAFEAAGRDLPSSADLTRSDFISSTFTEEVVLVSDKLLVADFPPVGSNSLRVG